MQRPAREGQSRGFFRLNSNRLADGGFEAGPSGPWTLANGATIVDKTDATWLAPHSGTWMLRLSNGARAASPSFPVTAGTTLDVTLWAATYDGQRKADVYLMWGSGAETLLGSTRQSGANWAQSSWSIVVPDGETIARLGIRNVTPDVRVDDVTIIQTEGDDQ